MLKINFMIHFFLEILHFKNPAIWLANSILAQNSENQNFVKYGTGDEILITILVLILHNFQEKIMRSFFKKSKKNYFRATLGPSFQIWVKLKTPGKKALSIFIYSNYFPSWKKLEKTNDPILRKMPNWRTDRQTPVIL